MDSLRAISDQTDDAIFFASTLAVDLQNHGEELRRRFQNKFGDEEIKVFKPDFKKAASAGLMPDISKYSDFSVAFQSK